MLDLTLGRASYLLARVLALRWQQGWGIPYPGSVGCFTWNNRSPYKVLPSVGGMGVSVSACILEEPVRVVSRVITSGVPFIYLRG